MRILISWSQKSRDNVEKVTRMQAESNKWFYFRTGRITASKFRSVCHANIALPPQSLIKQICHPLNSRFSTVATNWGCEHEKIALDLYLSVMKEEHKNFTIKDSGLFISLQDPFLGASPDSIVACDCCGKGCVEIKCPFCNKDQFIFETLDERNTCLTKSGHEIQINRNHSYFYQIQCQMFVAEKKYKVHA